MNRRQFLGAVAGSLAVAPVLTDAAIHPFPTRTLGRTGIKVPILGFGGGSRFLMYQDEDRALEALSQALDLGITYIDTAHSYGDGKSEARVGRLMPARRKEVVLATKLAGRTAEEIRRQIEASLKLLQTDRVDVLHLHALKDLKDLAAIEAKGGALEAMYEARDQKITRAIGITCHADPAALKAALERHDFDCTQMALNAGLARMADVPGGMKATPMGPACFEQLALPVAKRKNLGVIAMKVFGQEQLLTSAPAEQLLAYALSLPVSLASVGMPKPDLIQKNAQLARAFKPMSARQRSKLTEAIDAKHALSMHRFLADHADA